MYKAYSDSTYCLYKTTSLCIGLLYIMGSQPFCFCLSFESFETKFISYLINTVPVAVGYNY